jgi:hypothetical protein
VQKRFLALIPVLMVFVVNTAAQSQSAEPWLGTWKVDLAKSTYSPGPKPPGPGSVRIERAGGSTKTTIEGTDPQGQPIRTETVWAFDGKDHPVKGGPAANMTAAYKRVDDRTFEVATKMDGKPALTTRVPDAACVRLMLIINMSKEDTWASGMRR